MTNKRLTMTGTFGALVAVALALGALGARDSLAEAAVASRRRRLLARSAHGSDPCGCDSDQRGGPAGGYISSPV